MVDQGRIAALGALAKPVPDEREKRRAAIAALGVDGNQARVTGMDPDEYAKAWKLAAQRGLTPTAAAKLLGSASAAQARALSGDAFGPTRPLSVRSPELQAWLASSPENAILAQDDAEGLSKLDDIFKKLRPDRGLVGDWEAALDEGFLGLEASYYHLGVAAGQLKPSEAAAKAAAANRAIRDSQSQASRRGRQYRSLLQNARGLDVIPAALSDPASLLGTTIESLVFSGPSLALGAAGAAGGFAVAGPPGGAVGMVGGSFIGGTASEMGAWINQRLAEKGVDIYDEREILRAYLDTSLMARIEGEALRKGIGTAGLDALSTLIGLRFGKAAVSGVKRTVARKVGEGAAQSVLEGAGEALGQYAAVGEVDVKEVALESVASLGTTAGEMATTEALNQLSTARRKVKRTLEASRVPSDTDAVREAGEAWAGSKLVARLPQKAREFAEAQLVGQDSELFAVRFDTEEWDKFWAGKGKAPGVELQKVLPATGAEEYRTGQQTGTVTIPLGNFLDAYHDAPEFEELTEQARWRPNGLNLREHEIEQDALVSSAQDEMVRTDALYQREVEIAEEIAKIDEQIRTLPAADVPRGTLSQVPLSERLAAPGGASGGTAGTATGPASAESSPGGASQPSPLRTAGTAAEGSSSGPGTRGTSSASEPGAAPPPGEGGPAATPASPPRGTAGSTAGGGAAPAGGTQSIAQASRASLLLQRRVLKSELDTLVRQREQNELTVEDARERFEKLLQAAGRMKEAGVGADLIAHGLSSYAARAGLSTAELAKRVQIGKGKAGSMAELKKGFEEPAAPAAPAEEAPSAELQRETIAEVEALIADPATDPAVRATAEQELAERRAALEAAEKPPEQLFQRSEEETPKLQRTEEAMTGEQFVLPPTIDVDGKERPTRNSAGAPLAHTEEGIRNFWRWFGKSKIADEEGAPLILYHETADVNYIPIGEQGFDISLVGARYGDETMPNGIFLKPTPRRIGVATGTPRQTVQIPVYAKIENPANYQSRMTMLMALKRLPEFEALAKAREFPAAASVTADDILDQLIWAGQIPMTGLPQEITPRVRERAVEIVKEKSYVEMEEVASKARAIATAYLRERGHDGVIVERDVGSENRVVKSYVAFEPTQVKAVARFPGSTMGNAGTYDPTKPGIFYQRAPTFFSFAERTVAALPADRKMPADQWMAALKGKGVKDEELDWLGIKGWLSKQGKSVAQPAVLDFIAKNQIRIIDKGTIPMEPEPGAPAPSEAELKPLMEERRADLIRRAGETAVEDRLDEEVTDKDIERAVQGELDDQSDAISEAAQEAYDERVRDWVDEHIEEEIQAAEDSAVEDDDDSIISDRTEELVQEYADEHPEVLDDYIVDEIRKLQADHEIKVAHVEGQIGTDVYRVIVRYPPDGTEQVEATFTDKQSALDKADEINDEVLADPEVRERAYETAYDNWREEYDDSDERDTAEREFREAFRENFDDSEIREQLEEKAADRFDYDDFYEGAYDEARGNIDEDQIRQNLREQAVEGLEEGELDTIREEAKKAKAAEITELELRSYALDTWRMQHAPAAQRQPRPGYPSLTIGGAGGGGNYHELLLTLDKNSPEVQKALAQGEQLSHGGLAGLQQKNVLAWIRFDDRKDKDGNTVLFIEEIQSDWHQQGRHEGYRPRDSEGRENRIRQITDDLFTLSQQTAALVVDLRETLRARFEAAGKQPYDADYMIDRGSTAFENRASRDSFSDAMDYPKFTDEEQAKMDELTTLRSREEDLRNERRTLREVDTDLVPDAPFKTSWRDLAIKRMVRYAAEHGYGKMAWLTGRQSAERYNLATYVDTLTIDAEGDFSAIKNRRQVHVEPLEGTAEERNARLDALIGKPLRERLLAAELNQDGTRTLKITEAIVGERAQHHITMYDVLMPQRVKEIGKPWGVKVAPMEMADPAVGTVLGFTIPDKMKEDVLNVGQRLMQEGGGEQGVTEFTEPDDHGQRLYRVGFLEGANESTLVHEIGHVFLLMLEDLAELEATPQAMKDDLAAIREFLGAAEGQELTEAQYEQWARSWEAYLREGKAPSKALRSAFAAFRNFLLKIYRTLLDLERQAPGQIKLNDEIRGVMQRMLATDAEISEAQYELGAPSLPASLLKDMDEEERAAYLKQVQADDDETKARADRISHRALADLRSALASEKMDTLRNEVRAEVLASDGPALVQAMRDGTVERFDRTATAELYGERSARFKGLDKLGLLAPAGGLDPDTLAQARGATSADALIDAVLATDDLEGVIERTARRRLKERFPELLGAAGMRALQRQAAANEERAARLEAEQKILAAKAASATRRAEKAEGETRDAKEEAKADAARRRAAMDAVPKVEDLRAQAQRILAKKTLGEIRPSEYLSAARRFSTLSTDRIRVGDWAKVAHAKEQERLNHELYREAIKIRATAERNNKRARVMNGTHQQGVLGKAGDTFAEAMNGLLDQFTFRTLSQTDRDQRPSLAAWLERMRGEHPSQVPDVPAWLVNSTRRTQWLDLTAEQLQDVRDTIDQIYHFALTKTKLMASQRQAEIGTARAQVKEEVRQAKLKRKGIRPGERDALWRRFLASLRSIDSIARQIAGRDGWIWYYGVRPLQLAAAAETEQAVRSNEILKAAVDKHLTKEDKRKWSRHWEKIEGVDQEITLQRRIMVAINWGNAEGRNRLRNTFREEEIAAILNSLEQRHADFARVVWELEDSFWPASRELWRKLKGVTPPKVQAIPFTTKDGTVQWRGGYHRLMYEGHKRVEDMDLTEMDLRVSRGEAVRATTKSGSMIERNEVVNERLVLRLDFGVVTSHLAEIIHMNTHAQALRDVKAVLLDPDVKKEFDDAFGTAIHQQFESTIRHVAAGTWAANDAFSQGLGYLRAGMVAMRIGLRITTNLINLGGITQTMALVGTRPTLRAMVYLMREPTKILEIRRRMLAVSPYLRTRATTQQREIAEQSNRFAKLSGVDEAKTAINEMAFSILQLTQAVVDMPSWIAAYEQAGGDFAALRDGNEDVATTYAEAIAEADNLLIGAQGGGRQIDMAAVMRGPEAQKMFTTFFGFASRTYNVTAEKTAQLRAGPKTAGNIARWGGAMMLLYIVPAFWAAIVSKAFRGDEDDDEGILMGTARQVGSQILGTMVGTRELSGLPLGIDDYSGPAGAGAFSELFDLGVQLGQGELDQAFVRSALNVTGMALHLPTTQVRETYQGTAAWLAGDAPPQAILLGPPRRR